MMRLALLVACGIVLPIAVAAQAPGPAAVSDTAPKITVGGFVDGYYAFDFNRPAGFDRAYTTQPARHDEFNVNLAFVELKLDAPGYRGRFALQTGTSVQANYAGEPRIGAISGPDLARFIQEAVVGVKVGGSAWIDGGIFLSHLGEESFISRDNPIYTRSLVADYSPYYESGVKLTWQPTSTVSALFAVVNGWQNISETNSAKSVGSRVDYSPSAATTLSYYNYVGDEAPDSASHRQWRVFNGTGVRTAVSAQLQLLGEADYGTQQRGTGAGSSSWYGGMLIGRYQATPRTAIVGRIERYRDDDQVMIVTGLPDGFRANGASIGFDVSPAPRLLWRAELRGFQAAHPVFPEHVGTPSTHDAFVVTSLALTF